MPKRAGLILDTNFEVAKGAKMARLAVVILTQNEEKNILAAVKNAQLVATEVLIIDGGSTDKTCELAQKQGARVVERKWDNDFAAQRNFALEQTRAEWILYLDADERLNEELAENIKAVLKEDRRQKQYSFTRKSVAFGQEFNYGVLYPDQVARLFPRETVHWVGKVHERPECNLKLENLSGYVRHYTYTTWQQWEQKFSQYTSIWAVNAFENGKRITLPMILSHSLVGLFKMLILRKGVLDGWLGIYMCCNHFFYTMLKYLKLYEMQQKGEK